MAGDTPKWIHDEFAAELVALLRTLVRKYNSQCALLKKRITRAVLPSLYLYADDDRRNYLLELLSHLHDQSIVHIDYRAGEPAYVVLMETAVADLRIWLDVPLVSHTSAAWQLGLQSLPENIQHLHEQLLSCNCLDIYEPEKLLMSLSNLNDFLMRHDIKLRRISWRQLSAHFFFGDSKYLDSSARRSFLAELFPVLSESVNDRPLQLSAYLSRTPKAVLFVENWDTFLWLIGLGSVEDYHLLYTAGFKATARNIRHSGAAQFFYAGDFSKIYEFENFWFDSSNQQFDVYFWGDLDYSGLDILNKLSASFPTICGWHLGYEPMLGSLACGHSAGQAGKERQKAPVELPCNFSRTKLLPALDSTGLMLDQEWLLDIEVTNKN